MVIPTGLGAQLGLAEEITYGTPVTPATFFEFYTESLKANHNRLESGALRAGNRVLRSDRWARGSIGIAGDFDVDVTNKGMGKLFKHALGGVVTNQPDGAGNPTVYNHTFTPGDYPVGLTVQVGRPDTAGVAQPFTYHGCRVASWELACAVDEIARFRLSLVGEDEDTVTALASATYPTNVSLMTFVEGSLTLAGSAASVRSANVRGENPLASDRRKLGSRLILNPLENALRNYTGTLDAEFVGLTQYDRFVNGTEAALVLLFEGATISTTYKYQVKVTANVRFDGETPNVGGTEEIRQPLPFKCVGNTSASAITLLYQTTDVTP